MAKKLLDEAVYINEHDKINLSFAEIKEHVIGKL